ncbi:MAG: insulinase family protein [Salinivirgaceae bacterium]|nr:insulinase family protein [Salinivirgaceae bacterium]
MKRYLCNLLIIAFLLAFLTSCKKQCRVVTYTDSNGFEYQTVTTDPYSVRVYTLKNGLKVYLSVTHDEPRIVTRIAVKAGSVEDPDDNTGLAHYLEHMMFKGTPRLGTINWEKEKPLLDEIEQLYEQHYVASSEAERKNIYRKIDSVSFLASKYVVLNEIDALSTTIGASRQNAFTDNDMSVFYCEIPSNELDRFLQIESEQLQNPVMRGFHTELESIYEEFNQWQDGAGESALYAARWGLVKGSPYDHDVAGKSEHLRRPSITLIKEFVKNYYVPNNMAVCLAGDFNPDEAVALVNKYFGNAEPHQVVRREVPQQKKPTCQTDTTIIDPQDEFVVIGFLGGGYNSSDKKCINLIDNILCNEQSGLVDININNQQTASWAETFMYQNYANGYLFMMGWPNAGQTLDEVKDLLLAEVEKVKNGEFDDWMLESNIAETQMYSQSQLNSASGICEQMSECFIFDVPWISRVTYPDSLQSVSKAQLVEFAKTFLTNPMVVYKRQGANPNLVRVEKPQITPIVGSGQLYSEFGKQILSQKVEPIEPVYADFGKSIKKTKLSDDIYFDYVYSLSPSFSLNYVIEIGEYNTNWIKPALKQLTLLGTDKYSSDELLNQLSSYGLSLTTEVYPRYSVIKLSGAEKNAEKGMQLLEHILLNLKPDNQVFDEMVNNIADEHQKNMFDPKYIVATAFPEYARYGKDAPFRNGLSSEQMREIGSVGLVDFIKELTSYPHRVFYYGQSSYRSALKIVKKYHKLPKNTLPPHHLRDFKVIADGIPKVYVVDYESLQTTALSFAVGEQITPLLFAYDSVFNMLYNTKNTMNTIPQQMLRESKALVYDVLARFVMPDDSKSPTYMQTQMSMQNDKLISALSEMQNVTTELYVQPENLESACKTLQKRIETSRIIGENIYWTWHKLKLMNMDFDVRRLVYELSKTIDIEMFNDYFIENVAGRQQTIFLLGNKSEMDLEALSRFGEVQELTLDELFNVNQIN